MNAPIKRATPLMTRTEAGQSRLESVNASRRGPVNLIDVALLAVTNRANPCSPRFFSSLLGLANPRQTPAHGLDHRRPRVFP